MRKLITRTILTYIFLFCFPGPPGKPAPPTYSDIKDTSLILHWMAPEDNGGADIVNYVIEYREEKSVKWVRATKDKITKLEYKLTKLTKNGVYEFKVAAENKAGTGPFSDPSQPVKVMEKIGEHCHTCELNEVGAWQYLFI